MKNSKITTAFAAVLFSVLASSIGSVYAEGINGTNNTTHQHSISDHTDHGKHSTGVISKGGNRPAQPDYFGEMTGAGQVYTAADCKASYPYSTESEAAFCKGLGYPR